MTQQPAKATPLKTAPAATDWLRSLDAIEGSDLSLVGGKAFRLALLKRHGLNVPPGLILTTAFFEAQLHFAQLMPLWAGSPDVAVTTDALMWLAEVLKTKPLAKELNLALNHTLDDLFSPAADSFAVRSSAIDEDQRDHTFAGVHLTELGVPRGILPIAITRCWASALDSPALAYRQAHGMSIQGIRIAVLIQPMLAPESSGVGFTVNPLTGARDEFIIEASWGLGEAVVSGQVQPYFYRLAAQPPHYPLLEQREGSAVAPHQAGQPLSPPELTTLAGQLEQVRALMGEPQDIEWARQEEHFFLLQTRPVAALPEPLFQLDHEWSRGNYPEFLPELPSPLLASTLERVQESAISFYKELGFQVDGLGPHFKFILGRPYLNLTFLKRLVSQMGLAPGQLLQTIGYAESGLRRSSLSVDWGLAWQMRPLYHRLRRRLQNNPGHLRLAQTTLAEAAATLNAPNFTAPPGELLAQLRQHERILQAWQQADLGLATDLAAVTAIAGSLIAPCLSTPAAAVITALAWQNLTTDDNEFNEALLKLSEIARRQPETLAYLDETAQSESTRTPPTEFQTALTDFLARFGHRAAYEADIASPRYVDDPRPILQIIRQYVQADPPTSARSGQTGLSWGSLIRQSGGIQRWLPWRYGLAALLVKRLRRLLLMRDELNRARTEAIAACRRWHIALAQRWVERGWLAQADDIFWLTHDEVERTLMFEAEAGPTLSAALQARRATYQTYAETPMPFSLLESQIPLIQLGLGLSTTMPTDVLVGLPISPGQTRGTVLVLRRPDEFERIADDIILVLPSTDPAWLPLLRLAVGLVVEMGGLLSHGSVIAREYGLPAVANIVNVTQILHTGDVVLVDGSTGVVQLLQAANPPALTL